MRSHPVIPHYDGSGSPLDASLEVLALGDVVVEELEQEVALLLLEAEDATGELRVDEDGLLAGGRVRADEGVDGGDGVAADDAAPVFAVVGLLDGGMDDLESVEPLAELGGQSPIRLGLVHEQRIASRSRSVQKIEEGGPRRLLLVRHIRVPCYAICPLLEEVASGCVIGASVHQMDFWITLWCTRGGMDVMPTEVSTEIEGLLDG